jgi:pimeloyl-ACP methyl ester carboxylesterase
VAKRLWLRPPRSSAALRARNAALLSDGDPLTVNLNGRTLHGWALGDGPLAMLIHGWGGWAAQFGQVATALAARGLRAVTIDLPGHGDDRASRSDVFQFVDALLALADREGQPVVIMAHSIGAMAATMAFDDTPPSAAVFLAPALSTDVMLDMYTQAVGLRATAARELRRRVDAFVGDAWPLVNRGADLEWPHGPLLVVHDRNDPQTPFARSAELAERQPHVDLVEASGLGHNRVLRDPEIVRVIADFAVRHTAAGPLRMRERLDLNPGSSATLRAL